MKKTDKISFKCKKCNAEIETHELAISTRCINCDEINEVPKQEEEKNED